MDNIKKITNIPKGYPGIIEGTNEWYFIEEFADGDCTLDEAVQMYNDEGLYKGSCCHLIHYPDGVVHSPFMCSENTYISKPVWDEGLYFLAAEFENKIIILYHYDYVKKTNEVAARIPMDNISSYNLELTATPVSIYSFLRNKGFEIIWPDKLAVKIGEDEWFDFRNGDELYFSSSFDDECGNEHETVIVRDVKTGKIIEEYEGCAKLMPDGSVWRII